MEFNEFNPTDQIESILRATLYSRDKVTGWKKENSKELTEKTQFMIPYWISFLNENPNLIPTYEFFNRVTDCLTPKDRDYIIDTYDLNEKSFDRFIGEIRKFIDGWENGENQ